MADDDDGSAFAPLRHAVSSFRLESSGTGSGVIRTTRCARQVRTDLNHLKQDRYV